MKILNKTTLFSIALTGVLFTSCDQDDKFNIEDQYETQAAADNRFILTPTISNNIITLQGTLEETASDNKVTKIEVVRGEADKGVIVKVVPMSSYDIKLVNDPANTSNPLNLRYIGPSYFNSNKYSFSTTVKVSDIPGTHVKGDAVYVGLRVFSANGKVVGDIPSVKIP